MLLQEDSFGALEFVRAAAHTASLLTLSIPLRWFVFAC